MNKKVKDLFVRVVVRKMRELDKTANEILNMYPKLTEQEKVEIKQAI